MERQDRVVAGLASCLLLAGLTAAVTLQSQPPDACDARAMSLTTGTPAELLLPNGQDFVVSRGRPLTTAERAAVACYVQHVNAEG
jgi:hypothetical protein